MNAKIDLTKILKDCPKGTKFYSSIYGEVEVAIVSDDNYPVRVFCPTITQGIITPLCKLSKDGKYDNQFNGECTLFPSKDQRDWSKFTAPWYKKEKFDTKMVKPKFKVGDRVRHKETNRDDVYEISKVYDNSYGIAGFTWMIYMKYQDKYELVPNKFDPKTLKTFDRVLVRDYCNMEWSCGMFSHLQNETRNFICTDFCSHDFCIPYNDDTKHLVGTTDEAPEYYRYWED